MTELTYHRVIIMTSPIVKYVHVVTCKVLWRLFELKNVILHLKINLWLLIYFSDAPAHVQCDTFDSTNFSISATIIYLNDKERRREDLAWHCTCNCSSSPNTAAPFSSVILRSWAVQIQSTIYPTSFRPDRPTLTAKPTGRRSFA
jgi:hypothetical protein